MQFGAEPRAREHQLLGERPPHESLYRRARPASGERRVRDLGIPRRIAAGLGGFGIGLGLAELLVPLTMARMLGLAEPLAREIPTASPPASVVWVLRALGARDIVSGVGVLTQPRPAGWLWSRVAGDAIDLSLLGAAFGGLHRTNRPRLAGTMITALGISALDLVAAVHFTRVRREHRGAHTGR